MKKLIILAIVLLVIFVYGCQAPVPTEDMESGDDSEAIVSNLVGGAITSVSCTDSDGGKMKDVVGNVTYQYQSEGKMRTIVRKDGCRGAQVVERYCRNGRAADALMTCDTGKVCQNGACVTSLCGNGISDARETCSSCPADVTCSAGTVCSNGACLASTCGNGILEAGERCDGSAVDTSQSCASLLGPQYSGSLSCNLPTCQYNTSGCVTSTCTDNDPTNDPFKNSSVTVGRYQYYDACRDTATVNETICNSNGAVQYLPVSCPNSCRNGACLAPTPAVNTTNTTFCTNAGPTGIYRCSGTWSSQAEYCTSSGAKAWNSSQYQYCQYKCDNNSGACCTATGSPFCATDGTNRSMINTNNCGAMLQLDCGGPGCNPATGTCCNPTVVRTYCEGNTLVNVSTSDCDSAEKPNIKECIPQYNGTGYKPATCYTEPGMVPTPQCSFCGTRLCQYIGPTMSDYTTGEIQLAMPHNGFSYGNCSRRNWQPYSNWTDTGRVVTGPGCP